MAEERTATGSEVYITHRGMAEVYADAEEMFDNVDAVIVASPNFTHASVLNDVYATDLPVLVLRHHQVVAGLGVVDFHPHKARGRRKRQAGRAFNLAGQHRAVGHLRQLLVELAIEFDIG